MSQEKCFGNLYVCVGWQSAGTRVHAPSSLQVNDERIFFYTSPFLRARQTLRQIIDGGGWQLDGAGKRLLEANPDSPTDWAGHMDNFSTPKPSVCFAFAGESVPVSSPPLCVAVSARRHVGTRHTLGRHAPSRPTGAVVGIRSDPRLRELEFGNKQDPARMAEVMRERQAHGRFYYRFRSGESGCDVYDRMSSFWASLYRQMDNFGRPYVENVVIVAHGLTMRLFLMYEGVQGDVAPQSCATVMRVETVVPRSCVSKLLCLGHACRNCCATVMRVETVAGVIFSGRCRFSRRFGTPTTARCMCWSRSKGCTV